MATISRKMSDKRTIDRYVDKGLVQRADYENHLKQLPDEEGNVEWVEMDVHDAEMNDKEDGGAGNHSAEDA